MGGFCYALQGVFSLCGAFSFCGRVFLYAVFVFGCSVAFSGHCGRCFRFDIAVCALLFALVCSVTGQILSLLRFASVGSILYSVIFYRA